MHVKVLLWHLGAKWRKRERERVTEVTVIDSIHKCTKTKGRVREGKETGGQKERRKKEYERWTTSWMNCNVIHIVWMHLFSSDCITCASFCHLILRHWLPWLLAARKSNWLRGSACVSVTDGVKVKVRDKLYKRRGRRRWTLREREGKYSQENEGKTLLPLLVVHCGCRICILLLSHLSQDFFIHPCTTEFRLEHRLSLAMYMSHSVYVSIHVTRSAFNLVCAAHKLWLKMSRTLEKCSLLSLSTRLARKLRINLSIRDSKNAKNKSIPSLREFFWDFDKSKNNSSTKSPDEFFSFNKKGCKEGANSISRSTKRV